MNCIDIALYELFMKKQNYKLSPTCLFKNKFVVVKFCLLLVKWKFKYMPWVTFSCSRRALKKEL